MRPSREKTGTMIELFGVVKHHSAQHWVSPTCRTAALLTYIYLLPNGNGNGWIFFAFARLSLGIAATLPFD